MSEGYGLDSFLGSVLLTHLLAALIGFYVGSLSERARRRRKKQDKPVSGSVNEFESDGDSELDSDSEPDTHVGLIDPSPFGDFKMVLVIRDDLKMTKGKVAAQCSHATIACYKKIAASNPRLLRAWEAGGQRKITLKAQSEDELLNLEVCAHGLNLCARIIMDAGRTQVDPGTRTVLGIGPGPSEVIDEVTGSLKLY